MIQRSAPLALPTEDHPKFILLASLGASFCIEIRMPRQLKSPLGFMILRHCLLLRQDFSILYFIKVQGFFPLTKINVKVNIDRNTLFVLMVMYENLELLKYLLIEIPQ